MSTHSDGSAPEGSRRPPPEHRGRRPRGSLHAISLEGIYSPDRDGNGLMFHPAPAPAPEEVESLVARASKRILRFLQRRKVITLVTAPGGGEMTVVGDETRPRPPAQAVRLQPP